AAGYATRRPSAYAGRAGPDPSTGRYDRGGDLGPVHRGQCQSRPVTIHELRWAPRADDRTVDPGQAIVHAIATPPPGGACRRGGCRPGAGFGRVGLYTITPDPRAASIWFVSWLDRPIARAVPAAFRSTIKGAQLAAAARALHLHPDRAGIALGQGG